MYKCGCVHRLPFACQMNFGQLCSDVTLSSPSPPEKEEAQPARRKVQKGRRTGKNETRGREGMKGRLGQPSGFPDGAEVKNSPASAGDTRDAGSISGSERSPAWELATTGKPLVGRRV